MNENMKVWNKSKKAPPVNKKQIKGSFIVGAILTAIIVLTAIIPPIYITLAPGEYEVLGEGEWIAAGSADDNLEGRFFKIDRTSYLSGKPASYYEVLPSGFPISCAYAEEVWKGEFGVYCIDYLMLFVDYLFWVLLSFLVIYYFGYYTTNKKNNPKKKKRIGNIKNYKPARNK